jgi:hypothetical protein
MPKADCVRVTVQSDSDLMCAEFYRQTGRLCITRNGMLVREWFPPQSWFTIASVAGARDWGTRPSKDELEAVLEEQMSLLRVA